MGPEKAVQELAARMPGRLRSMRARMMLEQFQETLGVPEVCCPACDGTGWLSRRRLVSCPVCAAFQEVPEPLAEWYRDEMDRRSRPAGTNGDGLVPEHLRRARALREVHSTRPERMGRAATRTAHVHLPRS